jgi:hypothetical protein
MLRLAVLDRCQFTDEKLGREEIIKGNGVKGKGWCGVDNEQNKGGRVQKM